jgi:hypothetical protein
MPAMPYWLEIGAILSYLNEYCEDEDRARTLLAELKQTNAAGQLLPFDQTTFMQELPARLPKVPDPVHPGQLISPVEHIARDWLGEQSGVWDPLHPQQTGWWTGWRGNAEGIIRETVQRGLEVLLGVNHGVAPATAKSGKSKRKWRIDFSWACGSAMFQGWVTWADWGSDEGRVSVVFITPGTGKPMYATVHGPGNTQPVPPDYEDPAGNSNHAYGMWVIGQDKTTVLPPGGTRQPYPIGTGFLPPYLGAFIYTSGPVSASSPAEQDGGVKKGGRQW